MSLTTPPSVQKLQTALHEKAKGSPSFRFYALYDGADYTIDVQKEDPLARIMEITDGKGVDVGSTALQARGPSQCFLGWKRSSAKSARGGHSYKACELALQQLASHRFPLEEITTHTFGLKDVDLAIRSVGGRGVCRT
jgi:hypothetical protein